MRELWTDIVPQFFLTARYGGELCVIFVGGLGLHVEEVITIGGPEALTKFLKVSAKRFLPRSQSTAIGAREANFSLNVDSLCHRSPLDNHHDPHQALHPLFLRPGLLHREEICVLLLLRYDPLYALGNCVLVSFRLLLHTGREKLAAHFIRPLWQRQRQVHYVGVV